jgi:tryptophan synthase beta subunit
MMEEVSDTEDYRDSRRVLSRHYNELSEAFNNSDEKDTLEEEFKEIMNQYIGRARGTALIPSSLKGHRISMTPASSRKRKTHGTQHLR